MSVGIAALTISAPLLSPRYDAIHLQAVWVTQFNPVDWASSEDFGPEYFRNHVSVEIGALGTSVPPFSPRYDHIQLLASPTPF